MAERTRFDPDQELRHILAAIVDSSEDAILSKDLDGRILTWNRAAERMYGYTAGEAVGRSIEIIVPDDRRAELADMMARLRRGERVAVNHTVRLTKAGTRRDISLAVSPIRNSAGELVGGASVARDTTEQRRAASSAVTNAARWQAIFESAVDAIILIDAGGTILAFNPAAERLFGYREQEVAGRNIKTLMPEPYRSEHDQYLARYHAHHERHIIGIGRQVTAQRRDGTTFPVHLSVGEIDGGGAERFVGIIHDLTNRVRTEQVLREQEALARLGEMAAVLAHEIKNPLTAVSSAIEMVAEGLPPDGQERGIVREILLRLNALNELTNDLLLFARPPRPEVMPIDALPLLHSTADLMGVDPAMAGVRIDIRGASALMAGDPELLKIVFQNLLINAAQAMGGRGTIDVLVSADAGVVETTVSDSGPGIPPEVRARLFEPFFTTKARGTGLGLPTARRLLMAQQGSIEVTCPDTGGTTVVVRLPQSD